MEQEIKCMRRERNKIRGRGDRSPGNNVCFYHCRTNRSETSTYTLNTAPTTGDAQVTDGTGDTLMVSECARVREWRVLSALPHEVIQ